MVWIWFTIQIWLHWPQRLACRKHAWALAAVEEGSREQHSDEKFLVLLGTRYVDHLSVSRLFQSAFLYPLSSILMRSARFQVQQIPATAWLGGISHVHSRPLTFQECILFLRDRANYHTSGSVQLGGKCRAERVTSIRSYDCVYVFKWNRSWL